MRDAASAGTHDKSSEKVGSLRSHSTEFNFKEQCLFCEEVCEKPDTRNPNRKRKAVAKVSDSNTNNHTFKDTVLKICEQRTDEWSNRVKFRIQSVISDLRAAGAQYHKLCYLKFKTMTSEENKSDKINTKAFQNVCHHLQSHQDKFWSSVEVEDLYASLGGEKLD